MPSQIVHAAPDDDGDQSSPAQRLHTVESCTRDTETQTDVKGLPAQHYQALLSAVHPSSKGKKSRRKRNKAAVHQDQDQDQDQEQRQRQRQRQRQGQGHSAARFKDKEPDLHFKAVEEEEQQQKKDKDEVSMSSRNSSPRTSTSTSTATSSIDIITDVTQIAVSSMTIRDEHFPILLDALNARNEDNDDDGLRSMLEQEEKRLKGEKRRVYMRYRLIKELTEKVGRLTGVEAREGNDTEGEGQGHEQGQEQKAELIKRVKVLRAKWLAT